MTTINSNINVQNPNGAQNVNLQNNESGQNTSASSTNADFMERTSENDLVTVDIDDNKNGDTTKDSSTTSANNSTTPTTTVASTTNSAAAGTIANLQMQQESLTKQLEQLNKRLESAQKRYKTAQGQLSRAKALGKDTSKIDEAVNSASSTVSEINSKISQCLSSLSSISSQMTQAINSLNNVSTAANTGTVAVDGTANTTGATNVNNVAATNTSGISGYNTQKAQALADAATELHGSNPSSGGMCGQGVSDSIARGLGLNICGNGCDYKDLLRSDSNFVEVTDSFPTVESLDNLPAGAIVSWAPYNTSSAGSIYGHVFIADGKGNEISDFCSPMNNAHYANGGSWTVFLPV